MLSTKQLLSEYSMYRRINPTTNDIISKYFPNRIPVHTSEELESHLRARVESACKEKECNVAIALSGGIDSAILAKFMPRGSWAYTFKCVVPGIQVTDETVIAARYANECGLNHKVIEIYWEDFEKFVHPLMKVKGAPIHSIEVQIYKAALQALACGIDTMIFGEAADAVYGGLSGLLSKEWKIGDFIQRYSFLMPYQVLKESELMLQPFKEFERDGMIDPHEFISNIFINESVGSYINAAQTAGINLVLPYPETYLADSLDYARIRSGQNKYIVREVFKKLYPNFEIPKKTAMPRPMNEWLKNWEGPSRKEFYSHCVEGLTGDQKWQVWCMEQYLNDKEI